MESDLIESWNITCECKLGIYIFFEILLVYNVLLVLVLQQSVSVIYTYICV